MIKRICVTALLCAVIVSLMLKIKRGDGAGKRALTKNEQRQQAIRTPAARYDLYALKHDFLTKAHRLNEEKKYRSALIYYREASEKFAKLHNWENYVWVNGYIGRLYLYVKDLNYVEALPYLQKAYQQGIQTLGTDHPYMATIYYYLGVYAYYNGNADSSLQMHNKALEILRKNLMEESVCAADAYECRGRIYAELLFDNTSAEANFIRSIKIKESFRDNENKAGLTSSYYGLIHLSKLTDNYQRAETYCYEALKNVQYVKANGSDWIEIINALLAEIYSKQHRFEKAINMLNNLLASTLR